MCRSEKFWTFCNVLCVAWVLACWSMQLLPVVTMVTELILDVQSTVQHYLHKHQSRARILTYSTPNHDTWWIHFGKSLSVSLLYRLYIIHTTITCMKAEPALITEHTIWSPPCNSIMILVETCKKRQYSLFKSIFFCFAILCSNPYISQLIEGVEMWTENFIIWQYKISHCFLDPSKWETWCVFGGAKSSVHALHIAKYFNVKNNEILNL